MSRIIKFRSWDKVNRKMLHQNIDFGYIGICDDKPFIDLIKIGSIKKATLPMRDVVVMQYTGYKDKENREVYEGDMYSQTKYTHGKETVTYWKVVWNELEYGFNIVANIEKQYMGERYREDVYLPLRAINGYKMKYAGNIYENLEMKKI